MPTIPSLKELLEAGAHFGHQSSRWHPKMSKFIFGARQGVHIIELEKTREELEKTLGVVKNIAARGGSVLFVGTKSQAKKFVREAAESCGMPHVAERWLGGTLTNFKQVRSRVDHMVKLREQREKGELGKYTKMERLLIDREIEDLAHKVGGIEPLKKLPELVFISCDTNVNPTNVDYVIPMNDDAIRSIELITKLVAEAVNEGKAHPVQQDVGQGAKIVKNEKNKTL